MTEPGAPATDGGEEREPAEAGMTVAAVARRLGVAPATLRTWDRRYGVGPSSHRAGSHRRYTSLDLARLSRMRRLTLDGLPPADAARAALAVSAAELAGGYEPGGDEGADEAGAAAPPSLPAAGPGADSPGRAPSRGGGGRVVALPQAEPGARGIARAAMALDAATCQHLMVTAMRERGVVATWEDLLVPVLVAVGERWAVTGQGIEVEHLLSECVLAAMRSVAEQPLGDGRSALLAGAEEEGHSLPIHVLAAALAEQRVPTRVLGARVPRQALSAAVRRSGPAAVFVWAQRPVSGDPAQLVDLPALRPAPRLVVGGPGWAYDRLPPSVVPVRSLGEAVAEIRLATVR